MKIKVPFIHRINEAVQTISPIQVTRFKTLENYCYFSTNKHTEESNELTHYKTFSITETHIYNVCSQNAEK